MTEKACAWLDEHPEAVGERPPPAHLQTCATCRAEVERLERLLRRGLAVREVPVPPEVEQRILKAVAARHGRPRETRVRPWAIAFPLLAAAAALGIYVQTRGALVPHSEDSDQPTQIDAGSPRGERHPERR